MATDVPMPKLGLTMEEATIVQWLVADGDLVEADQPIILIETDKTETESGSPGSGRIHITGKVGDVYKCGERIAVLLAEGEEPPATAAPASPAAAPTAAPAPAGRPAAAAAPVAAARGEGGRLLASPNARRIAAERGVQLASVRGTGPGGRIVSEDVEAAPAGGAAPASAGPLVFATSTNALAVATVSARNLADLLGVDLAEVPMDPVDQRITRDGVALYVRQRLQQTAPASAATAPAAAAAPAPTAWPLLQEPTSTIRLSGMRGTIAKRMTQSLREMAQLTLAMDADMDAVLADRAERKAAGGGPVPSITDYVVAAASRALLRHPNVNAQVTEDGIALLPEVHMGLAVAVDGGLLVPVIRDAAHRELPDLAAETVRLAAAARAGSLGPKDLEGGTFSVSALGAFGVDMFTPVINPPNAGILGVGRLRDDLVLVDGRVATTKRLTLSLTWDHRVFDGVPAAEFCRTVVQMLAEPATLA
ncbi:MAG: 2-oxo acid dehydrogenase subunit E2 [Ilumatobacter sp.]|nr:2-oxo acid dehydrogenase subunit E2 [Ilumatobacter sp.]